MELVKINVNGIEKNYSKGISLLELSKEYQGDYKDDIILALVNNRIRELTKVVCVDSVIKFITVSQDIGFKTYVRGITFVLIKAIYSSLDREILRKVVVEYSVGNGLYCLIKMNEELKKEMVQRIKEKMLELIEKDLTIEKRTIGTEDAIELFRLQGMKDKEKLLRYRRVSKANIYSIDGFDDYYYGSMPPSTGMLKYFDLIPYDKGLVLVLPDRSNPNKVEPFTMRRKLFDTLKEANEWSKTMEVDTVGALNDIIVKGKINDLILIQEALQEKKIGEIAEQIKQVGGKKFIMIAGPSSSGKTTFSHRLSIQLRTHGLIPHPIALDDYFVNRDKTPLDEDGKPNFESLYSLDIESFNRDMLDLLSGKTVEMPSFNFKTGVREYKGEFKSLGEHDILVIEGIHGLNDELSYSLPKDSKFKIYISSLTALNIDEHNRIPTTDARLLRRLVRDARTRGASGSKTIDMWPSVRRGEEENIFPFQEGADVMFNSALIYELAILKQQAEPILFGIDRESPEYFEAKRLLKFLDYFLSVGSETVPTNSILKEFVGGSCFKV